MGHEQIKVYSFSISLLESFDVAAHLASRSGRALGIPETRARNDGPSTCLVRFVSYAREDLSYKPD